MKQPRVCVLSDGVNRGLAERLNQITGLAESEFVARMDADDLMHPDRLRRQISFFERVLLEGKERGYPLTRFVAGTEWALLDRLGVHDLIEYESRINNMFDKYDDTVCCTYDVSKFGASVIMDAMRVHRAVIIGGVLQENPFFVPPDEFLRELREREKQNGAGVG